MITKILILIGISIAIFLLVFSIIFIIYVIKDYYLESTIKRGTHLLFKVDYK